MRELTTLIGYIITDLTEPAGYLPFGIAAGVVFILFRHVLKKKSLIFRKNTDLKQDVLLFLIVLYAAVLFKLAFLSREPGSRTDISLIPFETWETTLRGRAFFIENILMFIPFGILIPAAYPSFRSIIRCTFAGFACSLFLELIQLATGRGFCQVDDVITNTAGTLIGVLLFLFIRRLAHLGKH